VRVLLLSQFYPPVVGGEERHVRNLAGALAQRGHQVSVATLWVPGACHHEQDGMVRVYRIRGTLQRSAGLFAEAERRHAPPFPDPELVLGLTRVMAIEKPDIVHAHNWLLASALPLKPFCRWKLVVTLHDYSLVCAKKNYVRGDGLCSGPGLVSCLQCARGHYGLLKGSVTTLGNFATGMLARHTVDRFIAVSRAVARHSRLAQSGVTYDVIPNFVPDDVAGSGAANEPCLRDLPVGDFILFVGDLMHLKGVDVLLNAYARLEGAPPLILIGRHCRDTPSELPPNVRIFSTWPHTAIMQAWRRALFAVVPSVGPEACATVVMEAMAAGKAVVATDIGGMPDLVDPGNTGLLVPPDKAEPLAAAMHSLLRDRDRIARMGVAGLTRVEGLKASSVVPRIERLYREVLHEEPMPAATPGQEFSGNPP
jgi:glycosyltransferase involved in cell wall biosynthesis